MSSCSDMTGGGVCTCACRVIIIISCLSNIALTQVIVMEITCT